MILKAGTYRFNDELDISAYSNSSEIITLNLDFSASCVDEVLSANFTFSGNKIYIAGGQSELGNNDYGFSFPTVYLDVNPDTVNGDTENLGYLIGQYNDGYILLLYMLDNGDEHYLSQSLREVTIPEQTVDDTAGNWFIANTNYNEVNAKPLAEITYNGETIAQLNAGETAILKCEGLPMETDIIVKVNG